MVNVLIPTMPSDTHAVLVKKELEKKGHRGMLWYTGDFPARQTHSFEFDNEDIFWHTTGIEDLVDHNGFDVVWFRRALMPVLPDYLHPEDVKNAKKENKMFYYNFWQMIGSDAVWVNPFNNLLKANAKLLQLKIAKEVGLNIPKTLVSNDPEKIKKYIQKYQSKIVYKTLYPMVWLGKDEARLTYTDMISLDQLPEDRILQAVPGIFQHKIEKAYEVRVTYMDEKYIAVKLNSQYHPKGKMDWRYIPPGQLTLEEITLPDHIDQSCIELMKELGVIFGCFDFIVTPDNEYYFLEINEQGQFLWIEDANSDIKMLDTFTDFLIQQGNRGVIK